MRRVQGMLSNDGDVVGDDTAAIALKEKRLTFTWLDGEVQSVSDYSCFLFKLLFVIYANLFLLSSFIEHV